jgi:aconitate hydratase
MPDSKDSFKARSELRVGDRTYEFFRLEALEASGYDVGCLPYSLRILLENLLRHEDGVAINADHIRALAGWNGTAVEPVEIAFMPARVLMQDFTGVPALVDLSAMRDALLEQGKDPGKVNPLLPVELVIDHSIQVDAFGAPEALAVNRARDYERNAERYSLLRWAQQAFSNLRVVPPNGGICHQVNLEHLARVVFTGDENATSPVRYVPLAYPDTVVGTDSHTPMVNGLGVLGWGVGGIEAEAAMLGQQIGMLIPEVLGFRLEGELREGATATDLVLTVTQLLRQRGVVGKFVEFYGPGVANVRLADRATIGNMSPEYGATCAIFPVDDETLRYLRFTGRAPERVALVEAYMKAQGLFHTPDAREPVYTDTLSLDLSTVEPSIAGPGRPQDRVPLSRARQAFGEAMQTLRAHAPRRTRKEAATGDAAKPGAEGVWGETKRGLEQEAQQAAQGLHDGAVVIAAITSCTNTSNPHVMLAAGLLARNAVRWKLEPKPWVKTSLAPGSKVVTQYLEGSGLLGDLQKLGFHVVGYGCTTCIGNSGPLPSSISEAISARNLVVCSVLSGNRNFEGRIHSEVRANYLMSPPLVVAYALAGTLHWDPYRDPIGRDQDGREVWLRDLWPSQAEIDEAVAKSVRPDMFERTYASIYEGDEMWQSLPAPQGDVFRWDPASTYVRRPAYLEDVAALAPETVSDVSGARVIAMLGHSVTTDHISPAGSIRADSPAGRYLIGLGVPPRAFNSYGARRGNHEVMARGTLANVRLRNALAPGTEGGVTVRIPSGEIISIYDAAMRYREDGVPLIVLAGQEYGSGSSRDWAAKGPLLLGIRAVIAEGFERIHRSNLIGMGILPLQFRAGDSVGSLQLSGREIFRMHGLNRVTRPDFAGSRTVTVQAQREDGSAIEFDVQLRIDTPQEALYYRHGGILPYVLRRLLQARPIPEPVPGAVPATAQRPAAIPVAPESVEEALIESFPASDPPAY